MLITGSDDKTIIVWNTVEWYSAFMHDKIRTIRPHKYLRKHDESIQALCVLPNGVLLSCAYDHMIYAWQYQYGTVLKEFEKKNEELRCMDFIDKQFDDDDYDDEDEVASQQQAANKNRNDSKLFIGTNQNGLIITIDISDLLEFENNIDFELMNATDANFQAIEDGHNQYEEHKEHEDAQMGGDHSGVDRNAAGFGPSENLKKFDEL